MSSRRVRLGYKPTAAACTYTYETPNLWHIIPQSIPIALMQSQNNVAAYLEAPRASPLVVKTAPNPAPPSPTQVVIKAHSIAINPLDFIIQQTGMIVPEDAYPFILGNDIAGEVTAVGSRVDKVKPGDRVIACAENGCFQLLNTVDQSLLAVLPDNVTYTHGSVLPLALCTAAVMLFQDDTLALDLPKIDPVSNGKVVLAWGGGSALGSCGIQMLKAAGYEVAAVAGPRNLQYCRDLGADYVYDYRSTEVTNNIVAELKGKDFAGIFCPIMSADAISICTQIAAQLGDSQKNKVVATSLAHAMPYQGELPEGVKVTYCKFMLLIYSRLWLLTVYRLGR